MRRIPWLLVAIVALAVGLLWLGPEKPLARPVVVLPGGNDGGGPAPTAVEASVRVTAEELPSRFSLALPEMPEKWLDPKVSPPPGHVRDRFCRGTDDERRRIVERVEAGARAGTAMDDALFRRHAEALLGGPNLEPCDAPGFCAFLAQASVGVQQPRARDALWRAGVACLDAAAIAEPAFPAELVIEWMDRVPWTSAGEAAWAVIERAVRLELASGEVRRQRQAVFALAQTQSPQALALLLDLADNGADETRRVAALALGRFADPRATAAFDGACAVMADVRDAACGQSPPEPVESRFAASHVGRRTVKELLAKAAEGAAERAALVSALVDCAKASTQVHDLSCLRGLAALDWAQARTTVSPAQRATLPELRRFETRDAFTNWLVSLGFANDPAAFGPATLTLSEALEHAGRAYGFDTETGMFPNEHDGLLRALARTTSGALDGAVFDEVAPPLKPNEEVDGEAPYILRAWMDGQRFEVTAKNLGDWYDVEAVIALLERLLQQRGRTESFEALELDGQFISVVAATPAQLEALRREGFLKLVVPE